MVSDVCFHYVELYPFLWVLSREKWEDISTSASRDADPLYSYSGIFAAVARPFRLFQTCAMSSNARGKGNGVSGCRYRACRPKVSQGFIAGLRLQCTTIPLFSQKYMMPRLDRGLLGDFGLSMVTRWHCWGSL